MCDSCHLVDHARWRAKNRLRKGIFAGFAGFASPAREG